MALPPAIFFALFFWLVSDEEEPNNLLLAVIGGLLMGLLFSLFTTVSERLRQRRLRRLGVWDGS
ncbi:hypothetical protein ABT218_21435 [Streptomyces sp. NPDC001455]|uniref:hypothetical protein n=1 Tax=Streptomyces sp. NPDC001455 TaxID=3154518 RepID=UPI00331D2838